jgi:hypothetical protein
VILFGFPGGPVGEAKVTSSKLFSLTALGVPIDEHKVAAAVVIWRW